jgi:hypothetical protein
MTKSTWCAEGQNGFIEHDLNNFYSNIIHQLTAILNMVSTSLVFNTATSKNLLDLFV